MKVTSVFIVLSFLFFIAILPFTIEAESLKWAGCGITKKAFMAELAQAYFKKTGVNIEIVGGGATKGIRDTSAGKSDIGGTCRHTLDVPEEKGVKLYHVAWDALVVVVHKDNPIGNITTSQLEEVLSGKIKNWSKLRGPDMEIKLFVREGKISGVGLMVRELVLRDPECDFFPGAVQYPSSGPLEKAIAETPAGIGITGVSSARKMESLKILKINNVNPTKGGLRSGNYTYVRPLYLVTRVEPTESVKKFIDFALSPEGQEIISAQGTINLEEGKSLESKYKLIHKGKYYEKDLTW